MEVVNVVVLVMLVLVLPLMIAALVLQIRAIAQPDREAANRLFGRFLGLMCAAVTLLATTSLLRGCLEG